jgi:hypothetical protein
MDNCEKAALSVQENLNMLNMNGQFDEFIQNDCEGIADCRLPIADG